MELSPEDLDIPDHAAADEAAAIAAAISAHLERLERDGESGGFEEAGWRGRRWGFAGRMAAVFDCPARVPEGAPEDPWTASGRRDRL